jgi:hypothetical protein
MLKSVNVTIQGTRPMLMNTSESMNPRNPIKIAITPLLKLKGNAKTEEVVEQVMKGQWLASGIWHNHGKVWLEGESFNFEGFSKPVLPVEYLCRATQEAAKASKCGKKVQQALSEGLNGEAVIEYDGPVSAEEMWMDEHCRFIDTRSVVISQSRVMKSRVRIPTGWTASMELLLDTSLMNFSDLENFIVDAGRRIGVGDYRPKFGRFLVTDISLG